MDKPELYTGQYMMVARMEEVTAINMRNSYLLFIEKYKDYDDITAAEIGVYEGINAKYLLLTCPQMKLYLVDAWDNLTVYTGGPLQSKEFCNQVYCAAKFNLLPFGERSIFTRKNSEDAVQHFPDSCLDYVYIDGDHTYEAVSRDMGLWYPKVKQGGMLAGHDVDMDGISRAVTEFIKNNNIPTEKTGRDINIPQRSDWWIWK